MKPRNFSMIILALGVLVAGLGVGALLTAPKPARPRVVSAPGQLPIPLSQQPAPEIQRDKSTQPSSRQPHQSNVADFLVFLQILNTEKGMFDREFMERVKRATVQMEPILAEINRSGSAQQKVAWVKRQHEAQTREFVGRYRGFLTQLNSRQTAPELLPLKRAYGELLIHDITEFQKAVRSEGSGKTASPREGQQREQRTENLRRDFYRELRALANRHPEVPKDLWQIETL